MICNSLRCEYVSISTGIYLICHNQQIKHKGFDRTTYLRECFQEYLCPQERLLPLCIILVHCFHVGLVLFQVLKTKYWKKLNSWFEKSHIYNLWIWYQWRIQHFPEEGSPNSRWGCHLLFGQKFPENCMKMKEFGPRGASLAPPLDPPMDILSIAKCNVEKSKLS